MSTEYRRGIPSTAHVEAATRLGLLWAAEGHAEIWRFVVQNDAIFSVFGRILPYVQRTNPVTIFPNERTYAYRPIRPDGTLVDWDVLDQEVARVGQQGQPQTMACNLTAFAQPQDFRADLWQRIRVHLANGSGCGLPDVSSLDSMGFRVQSPFLDAEVLWPQGTNLADILARWTIYQELKPLYDLVDGAQGEAAMPRDVEAEWDRQSLGSSYNGETDGVWVLRRPSVPGYSDLEAYAPPDTAYHGRLYSQQGSANYCAPLRNFAAVLDAVAERRVAERMRGQTPTVTSERRVNVEPRRFADVRPDRHGWRWWQIVGAPDAGIVGARFEAMSVGLWCWLAMADGAVPTGSLTRGQAWARIDSIWNPRTVIPTDEQGNPVSWESIGPTDPTEMRYRQALVAEGLTPGVPSVPGTAQTMTVQASPGRVYDVEWAPTNATGTLRDVHTARIRQLDRFVSEAIQAGNTGSFTPPRPDQFSNNPATPPLTPEGFRRAANLFLDTLNREAASQALLSAMQNYAVPGIHVTIGTGAKPAQTEAVTTLPLPLPRFTADELDDVDHSKTTKLDEVTLRRGKLPMVEQIAKYREVRARRTGGAVADALKESRIDCEVAQYVLERWAGGLGDADTVLLLRAAGCIVPLKDAPQHSIRAFDPKQGEVDRRSQDFLRMHNPTLDTSEKPSPTVQRERQEAEERRQRLAELRQRLAAERAAQPAEEAPTITSRFDLIEPDPQADPTASIRAWEARQAAAKVRPVAAPPRIAKPAAALRRPAIEVVDAEVDGLSRVEVVTALVGRAFNGGC